MRVEDFGNVRFVEDSLTDLESLGKDTSRGTGLLGILRATFRCIGRRNRLSKMLEIVALLVSFLSGLHASTASYSEDQCSWRGRQVTQQ